MMKKHRMMLVLFCLMTTAWADETVQGQGGCVCNVTARQLWPHNKVALSFVVADDIGEVLSEDENLTVWCARGWETNVATRILGDRSAKPGIHRIVWDMEADGLIFANGEVAFGVSVEKIIPLGGVQLWEDGPYWAECNVGATRPEEYGGYFWWGDTVGCRYDARNERWVSQEDGTAFSFSFADCPTVCTNNLQLQSAGYIDSTGNLVAAHDAATAHLGAPWRMPTDAEFSALIGNCDTIWTIRGGVYGRLVTGRGVYASKSIFLPAAGYGLDSDLYLADSYGYYWSSTPNSGNSYYYAWELNFNSDDFERYRYDCRYYGQSVRPLRVSGAAFVAEGVNAANVALADIDTTLTDGLVVSDSVDLVYSPIDTGSVALEVNGRRVCSASVPGTYAWSSAGPGTYVLTQRAGDCEFSRRVLYPVSDDAKELEIGWLDGPISNLFPNVSAVVTNVVIAPAVGHIPDDALAGCEGLQVTVSAVANVTNGYTNVVCLGWIGTGGVPATGEGNEVSFTVAQASTLRWVYETNYWVSVGVAARENTSSTGEGGSVVVKDSAGDVLETNELWAAAGTELTIEATASEGYEFVGWKSGSGVPPLRDEEFVDFGLSGETPLPLCVDEPYMLTAEFAKIEYRVTFDLGEHGVRTGGGELEQMVAWGEAAVAPTVNADAGYKFVKWSVAFNNVKSELTVVAQWEEVSVDPAPVDPTPVDPTPVDPTPADPTPEKPNPGIVKEIVPVEADDFSAMTYDGYLCDEKKGVVVGTIQVKAAKAKTVKKTGQKTTRLTIVLRLAAESKKLSISGDYDLVTGGEQPFTKSGRTVSLLLGSNGIAGSFEGYSIEGVPNVYVAKDADSKAKAKAADVAYVGFYNLIAEEGVFSVTVAAKGKVKVTGTTVQGKAVSVSTQLIVGSDVACIPVMAPKAGLSFTVWLGAENTVGGLTGVVIGRAGTLPAGSVFAFDTEAMAELLGDATYADYFPNMATVEQIKSKWVVLPDEKGKAGKVGKVVLKNGTVDESKLMDNPSGLKLTYTAKTGAFKGSFKAYVDSKGNPQAVTVDVSGVMVGDCGYGMATVKSAGSVSVTVGL